MGNLHQQPARGLSAPSSAGREPPNVWRSIFYPAELVKQREWWEKICEVTATAATGWKRCFLMKMSDIARCGALCSVFSEEEKWATAEGFGFTSGSNYRSKSRSLEWIHNREVRLQGISGFELEGYYRNPDAPHFSCTVKDLATLNTVNKSILYEVAWKETTGVFLASASRSGFYESTEKPLDIAGWSTLYSAWLISVYQAPVPEIVVLTVGA